MQSSPDLKRFSDAYRRVGLSPLNESQNISLESLIVRDLGLIGDDLDEVLDAMGCSGEGIYFKELSSELGKDAFLVSVAHILRFMRLSKLKLYLVSRIRTPDMTVSEFLERLQDLPGESSI